MRAFQTSINRRLDITFFQLDFRTQLLKAGNVNQRGAPMAQPREEKPALAKTRHQRSQRPNRRAHGFDEVIRSTENVDRAGIDPYGAVALNVRAQLAQQFHGGIDVFQLRYVLDLNRLFG